MRCLYVLLFLLLYYSVSAQPSILEKKITLKVSNLTIEDVLRGIEEDAGFHFSYQGELFKSEKKTTVNIQNKTLEEVLKQLLTNRYDYALFNNSIIIKRNKNYKYLPPKDIIKTPSNKPLVTPYSNKELMVLVGMKEINRLPIALDTPQIQLSFPVLIVETDSSERQKILRLGYSVSPFLGLHENIEMKSGVGTSLAFDFTLIKKIDFCTALSFSYQKLKNTKFDINQLNNCNVENLVESVPRNYESKMYLIDLSFSIRYNFKLNTSKLFITAGISNAYTDIRYDYYYDEEKVKYGKYYKTGYANILVASFGVERIITKNNNVSLQLEPFLKYSLTEYSPEKIKPIFLGLTLRINYNILL